MQKGRGVIKKDGNRYEGELMGEVRHGEGAMAFENGNMYTG